MSVAVKRVRVYVRAAIVLVALVAVAAVLLKNRTHSVPFWFFGLTDTTKPIKVVWLIGCTAAATLVAWWVSSLAWGLLRDLGEVRRLRAITRASRSLGEREAEIEERERRIDEKLHHAVEREDEDDTA